MIFRIALKTLARVQIRFHKLRLRLGVPMDVILAKLDDLEHAAGIAPDSLAHQLLEDQFDCRLLLILARDGYGKFLFGCGDEFVFMIDVVQGALKLATPAQRISAKSLLKP